ncbi:hypothetical protein V496_03490 [Pseudogymnoascus sp. VKM F-4515 (FW-2607)]|nr:hypothetical protein V496_03490 [Pseudogymnoascus sp. VKM F-4515 (FW-2607)]
MAKFGTDTGLFWWEGPEISHGYKLNIKSKYGRDTIPFTAIDGMLILSPQDPLSISAPSNFARLSTLPNNCERSAEALNKEGRDFPSPPEAIMRPIRVRGGLAPELANPGHNVRYGEPEELAFHVACSVHARLRPAADRLSAEQTLITAVPVPTGYQRDAVAGARVRL